MSDKLPRWSLEKCFPCVFTQQKKESCNGVIKKRSRPSALGGPKQERQKPNCVKGMYPAPHIHEHLATAY